MAKKNIENGGNALTEHPQSKSCGPKSCRNNSGAKSPPAIKNGSSKPIPTSGCHSSEGSSPRSSPPGFLAKHYAGCKWTEPPSPSCLPLPPKHWTAKIIRTMAGKTLRQCNPAAAIKPEQQTDQLKMLLKVQA